MRDNLSVLLIFALSLVQGFLVGQGEWQAVADDDGVKVSIRAETNDDMSVRVEMVTQAAATVVQAVLDDAPAYPEWVHRCDEARRLPGGTDDNYVYYSRINLPFPFQDKEVVARINQHWNDGTLTRSITAEPDALPRTDGTDRLNTYEAEWKVSPRADGTVSVVCTCRTGAGSGLPNWLRKEIMTGGPARTMAQLRDRLDLLAKK